MAKRIDICYIVSHGFALRMLLQTDLIGKLTSQGYHVGIISHNASDENLLSYSENDLVTLIEWNESSSIWDDDYLYKRLFYLEDISQNVALKEKFYNALYYSNSKHPWKRIRPLFYYLVYLLIKIFPQIRTKFILNEKKYLKSRHAQSILNEINPRLLVSTYPVSIMESKLLHAANTQSIPSLLHLLSWDNISCKGRFPVLPTQFIAWGEIMQDELMAYYNVPKSSITICGVPHFDEHIRVRNEVGHSEFIKELKLDPEKPYLFFAMSSPRFAPKEIDIVEWISKAVTANKFGADMQFVVRPHPQNVKEFTAKKSWLDRLTTMENERVKIDFPQLVDSKIRWSMQKEDMIRLAGLLSGCKVCFNSGSTVSIDALIHDKPVIITSFDGNAKIPYWNSARRLKDYAHLRKFIQNGGAKSVSSYVELEDWTKTYITDNKIDLVKRRSALEKECYKNDGKSTERVVEALSQQLKKISQ